MAGEPIITVVGNLSEDLKLSETPSGSTYVRFSIACTPSVPDGEGGYVDGTTLWMPAQAWNFMANRIADNFTKGDRVIATGRLVQEEWENDEGEKRSIQRLMISEIGADIRFKDVTISKRSKGGEAPVSEPRSNPPKAKAKAATRPKAKPKGSTRPKAKAKGSTRPKAAATGDLF